jgi:4'-phosphopantetheinyl transferase
MNVHWLQQREVDVAIRNAWLSAPEILSLNGFRFDKRRADWRLGRWTAKLAVASYLGLPAHAESLAAIEIRPARSGAPEVFIEDKPAKTAISLSHRSGTALCAVAPAGTKLGCDLEAIETHTDAFIADYFTPEEQALVGRTANSDRPRVLTLLWSAKESALKALQEGLRMDTRDVVAIPETESEDSRSWRQLSVRYGENRVFHGWWQKADDLIRTIVSDPPSGIPVHSMLSIASLDVRSEILTGTPP